MSKNNEHFPDTAERVAHLSGSIPNIIGALKFIHERLATKLDRNVQPDPYDFKNTDRCKEVIPSPFSFIIHHFIALPLEGMRFSDFT